MRTLRSFFRVLFVGLVAAPFLALSIPLPAAERQIDATIFPAGDAVLMRWNSTPGGRYRIENKTQLDSPWVEFLPAPAPASSNAAGQLFAIDSASRFFRVLMLDTEGPEIFRSEPAAGTVAASRSAPVRAWLRDLSGVATNSLALTIANATATNGPVTLADPRLQFDGVILSYTPAPGEFLGGSGDTITVNLAVADLLGNSTTNASWSFQLELAPQPAPNLIFVAPGTNASPQMLRTALNAIVQNNPSLSFVSSNAGAFTFTYPGTSSGLSTGAVVIRASLADGFTVVVTNVTDYPASNTVVVGTRPARLAELVQNGSLSSAAFAATDGPPGNLRTGLPLNHRHELAQTLYQGTDLSIELRPGSALEWSGRLDLGVNIRSYRLREFSTMLAGTMAFTLHARISFPAGGARSGTNALITPVRQTYGAFLGTVPVWLELVYEINAIYNADASAADTLTLEISGSKEILVGRRWSDEAGWTAPHELPEAGINFTVPESPAEIAATARIRLQPKVTVRVHDATAMNCDLQPYVEWVGLRQANPAGFDGQLLGGLTATVGLNLAAWDTAWGFQPDATFNLVPKTVLWRTNDTALAPMVTVQPLSLLLHKNETAVFAVEATGTAPLEYRWRKQDLYLGDTERVSGTRTPTLQLRHVQSYDAGEYSVEIRNSRGTVRSQAARLDFVAAPPAGMVRIPPGPFLMGDSLGDGPVTERPVHTVNLSAFYADRTEVTKGLWDIVYQWAVTHGYVFEYGAGGKAGNHPAHSVTWYDAVKWCNARSEKDGLTPAYYTNLAQTAVYRSGQLNLGNNTVKWDSGYRLPTEAEWEKAARGGLVGQRFPWGELIAHAHANYLSAATYPYDISPTRSYHPAFSSGTPYTNPADSLAPNGYGLHDMAGNVREWCWDWRADNYYSVSPATDPRGPDSGSNRTLRGGQWNFQAPSARCAFRGNTYPEERYSFIGFRCVLPAAAAR